MGIITICFDECEGKEEMGGDCFLFGEFVDAAFEILDHFLDGVVVGL